MGFAPDSKLIFVSRISNQDHKGIVIFIKYLSRYIPIKYLVHISDRRTGGATDGRTDRRRTEGRAEGPTDGWMDGRTDGRIDRQIDR